MRKAERSSPPPNLCPEMGEMGRRAHAEVFGAEYTRPAVGLSVRKATAQESREWEARLRAKGGARKGGR